jgi:organic radical activating enzyme
MQKILREFKKGHDEAFTVTGGDPLHIKNAPTVAKICRRVKEEVGCPIWLWTGYIMEELNDVQLDVLKYVDVVVDRSLHRSTEGPLAEMETGQAIKEYGSARLSASS